MSTYDDRLAALERKMAMLELRRTHDERRAEESTPSAIGVNLKEIDENMTILLGIVTKQEEATGELQESVRRVEGRLGGFDRRLEDLDGRLISSRQSVNNRFETVDKKLDQALSMLSQLTSESQKEHKVEEEDAREVDQRLKRVSTP